jgi:hypothetical protein
MKPHVSDLTTEQGPCLEIKRESTNQDDIGALLNFRKQVQTDPVVLPMTHLGGWPSVGRPADTNVGPGVLKLPHTFIHTYANTTDVDQKRRPPTPIPVEQEEEEIDTHKIEFVVKKPVQVWEGLSNDEWYLNECRKNDQARVQWMLHDLGKGWNALPSWERDKLKVYIKEGVTKDELKAGIVFDPPVKNPAHLEIAKRIFGQVVAKEREIEFSRRGIKPTAQTARA